MFSLSAAPAKQSVGNTIHILSGRLVSATLLEDRRAAILGLRSFAKDFPASVASGALRSLIGSLAKDGEDVDTVKVILETLLMLFNPNGDSPEASDEIFLWLADEFTQRQENVALLLDFLESNDFYSRLYSLQLLSAVLSARAQRTEECILAAPLGISRLAAALDDQREVLRNEAINLLTSLTHTSAEIQKLVAFESAFERIFAIIETEGRLSEGGRVVEDCLILLANLLRRNASNQSLFRESGCIRKLGELLRDLLEANSLASNVAAWAQAQRDRNMYAFIAILRLFLTPGSAGVAQNQAAFWKHGLVHRVLQMAFSRETGPVSIRAEALTTCGDMIQCSRTLQESFAQLTVPSLSLDDFSAASTSGDGNSVYVIDGLLHLILNMHETSTFDLRFAACQCLKSYFSEHTGVRLHFFSRAIDGYQKGSKESANVLAVLLRPETEAFVGDPYRQWFAAVVVFHLLQDNPTAKAKALDITEGDSEKGEEVVTSIQTITAHLISGISHGEDPRTLVGYLMVLIGWMFEDLEAVNEFLSEGSNVQSVIQAMSQPQPSGQELVQGLCAMLLGVAYEFSTKDSPVSRTTLHSILASRLNRENYLDRLHNLRSHPLVREFEVTPQKHYMSSSGIADVFFDAAFINFLKDNYGRIARAIDRSPELEISVMTNGVEKGVSRELVDSLRYQKDEKDRELDDARAKIISLQEMLEQKQAEVQRISEASALELSRCRGECAGLRASHEAELRALQELQAARDVEHERRIVSMKAEYADMEASHQDKLARARQVAQAEVEHMRVRTDAEFTDLRATISRLEVDLAKSSGEIKTSKCHDLAALRSVEAVPVMQPGTEQQLREAERAMLEAVEAKDMAQSELDDLLTVLGDMEDKVARYKARLRGLREVVSDSEDDEQVGDSGSS